MQSYRRPRSLPLLSLAAVAALSAASSACSKPKQAHAQGEAASPATPSGQITSVEVAGDKRVLVVDGNRSVRRPIVHLHGMCADPREDLDAWGAAVAREHGTVVAVMGDLPCPDKPGKLKWSEDAAKHDGRIVAAIEAVNAARGTQLDTSEVLVIGESMGAARAELLAASNPERYSRLVLVGSPQTPSPDKLAGVRAVASLAGAKEGQANMKNGAAALSAAGKPAQFWELPGAVHGEYGPRGPEIMTEAVAFVATK